MINSKINLFEYATKELSQDAVFCYILDCFNDPDKKEIATGFLELNNVPAIQDIKTLKVKRQEDNIDVKAVLEYSDQTKKCIIIEDKVFTSIHNNQLTRYKEATVDREGCDKEDIIGIYFQIGTLNFWEKKACKAAEFNTLGYLKFNEFVCRMSAQTQDPVLGMFSEFFKTRIELYKRIDELDFDKPHDVDFEKDIIGNRYGQYKLMTWLMKQIFGNEYDEKRQHIENNYGVPCTQYRFIFNQQDKAEEWKIKEERMLRKNYCAYFRIDRNKKGGYLAIRLYFINGATKEEADEALRLREELLALKKDKKDDVYRLAGKKEKTLLLFNIDSVEKVKEYIPLLIEAKEYLMNRARTKDAAT